jgi:hypothetical protein
VVEKPFDLQLHFSGSDDLFYEVIFRRLPDVAKRLEQKLGKCKIGELSMIEEQELKDIAADFQKLLQVGLPLILPYKTEALYEKMAHAFSDAARVCERRRDYPQASQQ